VIETTRDELAAALPSGVVIEDKGYGVTVHWRGVVVPTLNGPGEGLETISARATAVARAAAAAHGLVARPGKASVELVLPLGIDKGTVVRELCGDLGTAAFLGDDAGDLLAFRALEELHAASGLRTLRVAVNGEDVPQALVQAADLVLDGPPAAVSFLVSLADRLGSPAPGVGS
jgi:trehalose-phosphatase